MSHILERYSTAIHASTLKPDATTTYSDLDVIGAAGLAARYEPIGIALARMLSGGGDGQVIAIMARAAFEKSFSLRVKVTQVQAADISRAVIAWFRDGRCNSCGGTGYRVIPGTPSLGDDCPDCKGTGKIPFEPQFRQEWRDLARWLSSEVERSQAAAGQAAMAMLAPRLDF